VSERADGGKERGMLHGVVLFRYMPCWSRCTKPYYIPACGSIEPYNLMSEYTRLSIESGTAPLRQVGVAVPEQCQEAMKKDCALLLF
jgi:hypothetical protein